MIEVDPLPRSGPLLAGLCLALLVPVSSQAGEAAVSASEHNNLALILRQLDAIERMADTTAELPAADGARYFFDYPRLKADLDRVRQGIRGYLVPSRAQPRDPAELTGHYSLHGGPMP